MKSKFLNLNIRWTRKNSKWGINTKEIDPLLVNYIHSQEQFKWISADDHPDVIKLLLHARYARILNEPTIYVSPYSNEIKSIRSIKKEAKFIDWECAICTDPIEVRIGEFSSKDLTCPKCYKDHIQNNKLTPDSVVRSSVRLKKVIMKKLEENQKKMTKWIRKS